MAARIIQSLRALASKIETLGEGADEIIDKNKDLASDFRDLLEVVPATWKKNGGNRLYLQVTKNEKRTVIDEEHKKVIWGWRSRHDIFCSRQVEDVANSDATLALDGLLDGIKKDDTDLVLAPIHWRISLLLVTVVKNRVCKDTNDNEEIARCFHSNGLVSTNRLDYLKKNLPKWLHGGAKYEDLSRSIGGYGSLIYLPEIGRSNYELYYNPSKESAFAVIGVLSKTITTIAAEKFAGFNAHEVVDGIVEKTVAKISDYRLIIVPVQHADIQPKCASRVQKIPSRMVRPQANQRDSAGEENRNVESTTNKQAQNKRHCAQAPGLQWISAPNVASNNGWQALRDRHNANAAARILSGISHDSGSAAQVPSNTNPFSYLATSAHLLSSTEEEHTTNHLRTGYDPYTSGLLASSEGQIPDHIQTRTLHEQVETSSVVGNVLGELNQPSSLNDAPMDQLDFFQPSLLSETPMLDFFQQPEMDQLDFFQQFSPPQNLSI